MNIVTGDNKNRTGSRVWQSILITLYHCATKIGIFKVAEHSFQEPMPNSPLLFSHLCFGARFLQE